MLDRTQAPAFEKSSSFDLISPIRTTVAGGAQALFVLGGSQNVCKIELLFQAGRWNERVFGAGYFTSQLLSKGTKSKTSFQIAQAFDQLGAHLEVNPGADFVSVALYSLTRNLESSLELLIELLLNSIFPEKELSQLKTIYLQNLRVNKEKTSFQSSVLFRRTLYGTSHPYGKELDEADVQRLAQQSLLEHFNEFFKEATLIVSGKVSEEHKQLIVNSFGFLKHQTIAPAETNIPVLKKTSEVISKEGSVQASIRMGKPFFGRLHPDYAVAILLNHILGGYFGSRLMKNIREEKGLTYGISSSLSMALHGNHFVIGADVNLENVELAFGEIKKEMKRLREEPIDATELEVSRNHFIGSLQLEITTSFAHADKVKNITIFGLPNDYYQRLIHRIDAISADDLMAVANRHFQEEELLQIAVG
ncbi:MAG: pitrilysin family protein [Chryseolinea sp.]